MHQGPVIQSTLRTPCYFGHHTIAEALLLWPQNVFMKSSTSLLLCDPLTISLKTTVCEICSRQDTLLFFLRSCYTERFFLQLCNCYTMTTTALQNKLQNYSHSSIRQCNLPYSVVKGTVNTTLLFQQLIIII